MYRVVFLLIMLVFQFPVLYADNAQEYDYQMFDNIHPDAEVSAVNCFLQDTQGMMWMGTDKGLFAYDGYSAQPHFKFGTENNTHIYCGVVADSTYLYLGADDGLLIYNYRTDTYEDVGVAFPTDVRSLAMYDGQLWLGTLNGLFRYNPKNSMISAVKEGLPHQTIYSLLSSSDNKLYIGTYNGCCRYSSSDGKFEPIKLPVNENKSNLFINSLLEDTERGCIWIGTEGYLLKYINGEVERVNAFAGNSIKSMALDGDGQLLVGTDNGLYVYRENTPLQHIVHDSRNNQSLSSNIVWTIYADVDRNMWLGTDYGVSMSRHNETLRYIPLSQITGTGEGNRFYAMLRDDRGDFWFGGTNGLVRFSWPLSEEEATGKNKSGRVAGYTWYKMGDQENPLSHNRVRQLYEDRDRQLWVATDGGVSRYDARQRRFISYNIVDSTYRYNANWAYRLFEDETGNLWIATCLGGIFVVDKEKLLNSSDTPYLADKTYSVHNGLSGMFINQMVPDHAGNVWALLYNNTNRLEKINRSTGMVSHFLTDDPENRRLLNNLLCAEDGSVWIGYLGGVMRMTPSDGSIQVLPFDRYRHYEVLSMVEADGKIWISTTNGLWVANQQTLKVRRLNVTDRRFTGMYFDQSSCNLYLGTVDGFAVASLSTLLKELDDRELLLTGLYINNQLYQPDEKEGVQSIRYTKEIRLRHGENNLTFEFSDLPYSVEEKSRLIYRLEGADDDWILLPFNDNQVTYTDLEYGDYVLEVSKLDAYGNPVDRSYFLNIHIAAPWYYTWWAKAIYFLLSLGGIIWVIHFFKVKSRLKTERLEKERILEQSRAKIDFFSNLSHDLKTPLSMIVAPVSKLLSEMKGQKEKQQLELIQRNAMRLNALIHQGLDFNRMDDDRNTLLILSQIELVSFARKVLDVYAEERKNLVFDFHAGCEKLYVQMDAIKLESILNNLLFNAVKYTPEGGNITLSLEIQEGDKAVALSVSDTGIGIPKQDQPYVFQRFFQSSKTAGKKEGTGIGLYLVKTYTELHGGKVTLLSEENRGTTVTLSLPVLMLAQNEFSEDGACAVQRVEADSATGESVHEAPLLLVVEDNPEVAAFIGRILQDDYRLCVAENGRTGLELAMERLPDLIITDVMMPVMNGLDMVSSLKKQIPTSTMPIILLTAKSDKETELESIRLHVDAFISKPFEPDILLSRIEQLLYNRKTHEVKTRMEILSEPKAIEAASHDEKFLAGVIHLIEEHISDSGLNVNALCEWTATNPKQMYRKIKQLTGMTPVEYIKSIRMKKAAMLLKQQKFTIAEVMYLVGFSNHSYFSKCFQSEFGVTPKQYKAD